MTPGVATAYKHQAIRLLSAASEEGELGWAPLTTNSADASDVPDKADASTAGIARTRHNRARRAARREQ